MKYLQVTKKLKQLSSEIIPILESLYLLKNLLENINQSSDDILSSLLLLFP